MASVIYPVEVRLVVEVLADEVFPGETPEQTAEALILGVCNSRPSAEYPGLGVEIKDTKVLA